MSVMDRSLGKNEQIQMGKHRIIIATIDWSKPSYCYSYKPVLGLFLTSDTIKLNQIDIVSKYYQMQWLLHHLNLHLFIIQRS